MTACTVLFPAVDIVLMENMWLYFKYDDFYNNCLATFCDL